MHTNYYHKQKMTLKKIWSIKNKDIIAIKNLQINQNSAMI